ncbi:MAG: type 4a pilus biogenesis protein PilO [Proteobacteria bacterium]|nr:type 4a pilus biogenesis protein PilO [Pseudomonadota bacterium]
MAKTAAKPKQAAKSETTLALIIIVIVAIGIVFYFFFYSEESSKLESANSNIAKLRVTLEELKVQENQLVEIRRENDRLERQLSALRAKIPATTDELNLFLDSVNQRARSSRVSKWTLFRQEGLIPKDEVSAVPIRMEFMSTYEAALQFFWDLASMGDSSREQIINIREVSIERQSGSRGEEGTLVKVSCVAETYLYTGVKVPDPKARNTTRR